MDAVPFTMEEAGMKVGTEKGQEGRSSKKARFEEEKDDMLEGTFCGVNLS